MSSKGSHDSTVQIGSPPEDVRLTNWPLRYEPISAWSTIAATLLVAAIVGNLSQSVLMGFISLAVLNVALWRLWVPVSFELGRKGVVQTVLGRARRISWSMIAGYDIRRHGVLLLADADSSPLAAARGLFIRWGTQRDALLKIVEYYLGQRNAGF
jgi:hypothetical protein